MNPATQGGGKDCSSVPNIVEQLDPTPQEVSNMQLLWNKIALNMSLKHFFLNQERYPEREREVKTQNKSNGRDPIDSFNKQ